MRIATNNFITAIIKPMASGYFVTIGKKYYFFDKEENAIATLKNKGFNF